MLIGVPASGKSFWIKQQDLSHAVVISSDDIIQARADTQGKTYDQVFKKEVKSATTEMMANLRAAIEADKDVVWDQTNVTAAARAKKLALVPDTYEKVAVFFCTPDAQEHARRLASREGKNIPWNVIQGMKSQLEAPTPEEGFDKIILL
jgi:predicted kinase